jgi:hypothetical protein
METALTGRSPRPSEVPVAKAGRTKSAAPPARPVARDPVDLAPGQEEILVPLSAPRERLPPVTQFRSTLLTTSLKAIRDRGHGDRYLQILPPQHHDAVRACIAGVWLPIDLGLAHYAACNALGLSSEEQMAIGREVGLKIQGTFLGTVVKLAKAAGVTPWLCLTQYQRLWDRLLVGGGVVLTKLGPKEARLECLGAELARIPYFRTAFRGLNESSCELFCSKAYVVEIKSLCTPTSLGYRIAWA